MPDQNRPVEFRSFDEFFTHTQKNTGYWVELAKLEFTEDIISRMKQLEVSKSQLANKLSVTPAMITRLLSGRNNFELATMVKLALALECTFKPNLQPDKCTAN